ncbi:metallophosphoesterase family protein [Christiangramia forsetii]|nr:metallophosphoesterase family protein [Christiangramia forsetii]GGG28061.1 phosphoesterase [Christiangramia forsetii]
MAEKVIDLNNIEGRILVFGGVYSNLQALQELIHKAESLGIPPENCICTGDIVGYCAQPEETVQAFRKWGAHSIAGNVEIQLAEDKEDCGCDFREGSRCDDFSKQWYPYAKIHLSQASIEWMKDLPLHIRFNYVGKKVQVVHGSAFQVSEFIFKSTDWSLKQRNFTETDTDVIIAGHCGLPFSHSKEEKLWLNPGVIGMPANDGSPKTWYAVLDSEKKITFDHHSLKYDHQLASSLMMKNQLPQEYARTLITGIWDNTEILPGLESGLQGFGLNV